MNTHLTTNSEIFGILYFQDLAQFENPYWGLSREEMLEKRMEKYLTVGISSPPEPVSAGIKNWPRITDAIKRVDTYHIESKSANESFYLRFDPNDLDNSYYIIKRPRAICQGHIERIANESDFDEDARLSMLSGFKTKFCLFGADNERPHLKCVWMVGLNYFKHAYEVDLDGEALKPLHAS